MTRGPAVVLFGSSDMIITRRIRLTSALLALRPAPRMSGRPPRREFVREKGAPAGMVRLPHDLARWQWAFLEARDHLGFEDVAVGSILPTPNFSLPERRLSTYTRRFKVGGKPMQEEFECISSGNVLEWGFTLSKHLPPHEDTDGARPAEEEEFDAMLAHIGEMLGMSQWGHHYLYGRFEIRPNLDEPGNTPVSDIT